MKMLIFTHRTGNRPRSYMTCQVSYVVHVERRATMQVCPKHKSHKNNDEEETQSIHDRQQDKEQTEESGPEITGTTKVNSGQLEDSSHEEEYFVSMFFCRPEIVDGDADDDVDFIARHQQHDVKYIISHQFKRQSEIKTTYYRGINCTIHRKSGQVSKWWILLDSQPTVDVIFNKKLLQNIRKCCVYLRIHCNAGVTRTNLIGDLPVYGTIQV